MTIEGRASNSKDFDTQIPYITLGEIARDLDDYFILNNEETKNARSIIVKKIPQFFSWIEKSKLNINQIYN